MKIMNRKLSLLPILLIAVVSGTLVIAQVLFSVQMPSSVTVKTVGEIVVTDLSGNPLASLVFGEIDPDNVLIVTRREHQILDGRMELLKKGINFKKNGN